jgi:hypothetical protein
VRVGWWRACSWASHCCYPKPPRSHSPSVPLSHSSSLVQCPSATVVVVQVAVVVVRSHSMHVTCKHPSVCKHHTHTLTHTHTHTHTLTHHCSRTHTHYTLSAQQSRTTKHSSSCNLPSPRACTPSPYGRVTCLQSATCSHLYSEILRYVMSCHCDNTFHTLHFDPFSLLQQLWHQRSRPRMCSIFRKRED